MERIWNKWEKSARKALLKNAGYSENYCVRAFEYLPSWVRDDLTYAYKRLAA